VVGISTLAATAHSAWRQTEHRRLACAIDARMGEVYWGCFTVAGDQQMTPLGEERVVSPDEAPPLTGDDWLAAGNGWRVYPELGRGREDQISDTRPSIRAEAQDIAVLAEKQRRPMPSEARTALPVYLRNRVAKAPGE
jgi:tRNA threonylcarbamoyladenosine biosynthesis protein TsaB